MSSSLRIPLAAVAVLFVGGVLLARQAGCTPAFLHSPEPVDTLAADQALIDAPGESVEAPSPVTLSPVDQSDAVAVSAPDDGTVLPSDNVTVAGTASTAEPVQIDSGLNAYDLGRTGMSDAEILAVAEALRTDGVLRQSMIEELRAETDPERQRWLVLLLAESGAGELTPLASELVYSGNEASRKAGFDLLLHLQPIDPAARQIVVDILSTETETPTLMAAMDALSTPGFASIDEEQFIVDQLVPLTGHTDTAVRNRSVSILSRWGTPETLAPVLQVALTDPEPAVQTTAVFAVARHPTLAGGMVGELLGIAEDDELPRRMREGALLALQRITLSDDQRNRLRMADQAMNLVR